MTLSLQDCFLNHINTYNLKLQNFQLSPSFSLMLSLFKSLFMAVVYFIGLSKLLFSVNVTSVCAVSQILSSLMNLNWHMGFVILNIESEFVLSWPWAVLIHRRLRVSGHVHVNTEHFFTFFVTTQKVNELVLFLSNTVYNLQSTLLMQIFMGSFKSVSKLSSMKRLVYSKQYDTTTC